MHAFKTTCRFDNAFRSSIPFFPEILQNLPNYYAPLCLKAPNILTCFTFDCPLSVGFLLQYVVHFPKGEKYVSILRDAEEPAAQVALIVQRDRLRALVHKQQAEIAMVTEADEGAALLARQRRPVQQPITAHEAPADVRAPNP